MDPNLPIPQGQEQFVVPVEPKLPPGAILHQGSPVNILTYRAAMVAQKLRLQAQNRPPTSSDTPDPETTQTHKSVGPAP